MLSKLKEELDGYVWVGLKSYLEASGEYFSDPEDWTIEDGVIVVTGMDGCMGHYAPETVHLGLDWITEPELTSARFKEDKRISELEQMRAQEESERLRKEAEFEKLKKELGE